MKVIILLMSASVAGCTLDQPESVASSLFSQATPICALLEQPQNLVGHSVLVSGFYASTPHGRIFFDPNCDRGELPLLREGSGKDDARADLLLRRALTRKKNANVPVVYYGRFVKKAFFTCSQGFCSKYQLEEAVLVAAKRGQR